MHVLRRKNGKGVIVNYRRGGGGCVIVINTNWTIWLSVGNLGAQTR